MCTLVNTNSNVNNNLNISFIEFRSFFYCCIPSSQTNNMIASQEESRVVNIRQEQCIMNEQEDNTTVSCGHRICLSSAWAFICHSNRKTYGLYLKSNEHKHTHTRLRVWKPTDRFVLIESDGGKRNMQIPTFSTQPIGHETILHASTHQITFRYIYTHETQLSNAREDHAGSIIRRFAMPNAG